MERKGVITVKGNGVTLLGPKLRVGDKAPEFTVVDKGLAEVKLGDLGNNVKIISVTPSLDTPVCDAQLRRFNQEAANLPNTSVVNISMDLPFAVARFCSAAGIEDVQTLSDHRDASFGSAFGVLIKELRLHARSIFVLDSDNTIQYLEIVPELTDSPNFEKALEAAKGLAPQSATA